MVVRRSRTGGGPEKLAIAFGDGHVVDAGFPPTHQAIVVELPEFVAVAAEPLAGVVVPLVLEADRDAAVVESPKVLHQPIVKFSLPFPGQERLDLAAAVYELIAVAPNRVSGVGQGDANRIARVPGVFGGTHLGQCRLQRERWSNGNRHGHLLSAKEFALGPDTRVERLALPFWLSKNGCEKGTPDAKSNTLPQVVLNNVFTTLCRFEVCSPIYR